MEKPKRPYSLFKRPTVKPNTYIYYCRFRDENGDYMSPISTLQFSKAAARNWADQRLREGRIILPGKRGMTFESFASCFWDYEGEYIQRKIARGGHFSRIFAQIRGGQVQNLILPHFQGQTIRSIRRHHVESWIMGLYKDYGLVPASLNRILDCMKVMMKEAVRRGYINADPAVGMESFTEKFRVHGIITPDEIHALFGPSSLSSVWRGERVYFAASILGVATGLRQGEIRGLRIQDFHPQYITVCGSWEERRGLHGAKWGSERLVPSPTRVAIELDSLIQEVPFKELRYFFHPSSRSVVLAEST